MKRFNFRLDRVLQLRETAEESAARNVALAKQDAEIAALRAGAAERALLHAVAQATEYAHGTTAGVLAAMRLSLDGAREQVKLAAETRTLAEQLVEQRLEIWRAARAERQALEKLKEQRKTAWTVDANRAEQADIDEVAQRSRFGQGDRG